MENYIKELEQKIADLQQARKTVLWSLDILPGKEEERLTYASVDALNKLINNYLRELANGKEKMNTPEWMFYYQYTEGGKRIYVETKRCKQPSKTGIYRTLKKNLAEGFIYSYGYDKVED
jgi:hypothetical protein